ncbi:SNF-related serine/threonine-protein kinase isoform X2 [Cimex lectularius]|nr:SNF-related serine/threonine-protein kinase isoform X2 [Cimex lectularius]
MQRSQRCTVGGSGYDGKIAGLYDLEATLGRGHFAVVKLARHVFTGEKVAVKVIDKCKLDGVSRAHLFQEVRCMKLVQHPNVVRLYEVIDTQTKLYLVLELADGGDLYDYIMRHESGLSEPLAREYFGQIVRAISYCHRLHVVHRDLKPENVVFFEKDGVVKLTDFGFSNKFCPGQKLETSCGSLAYSAPEILLGDSYDAPAVDVWSLGVILYMLVCGQAPFQEVNDSETLTMIMDCKYTVPNHVSPQCKRLIGRMLVRQPDKRATLDEIASDPWVSLDTLSSLAMPLISSRMLSEADHATVVQKMVNGNICTKEEIIDSLEKNDYNYITATYYLLAERKLRALDPKPATKIIPKAAPVVRVDSCAENEFSPVPMSNIINSRAEIAPRTRKCSIVNEDDEEESSSSRESGGLNRRGSRSEGKLHLAVQEIRRQAVQINSITEASTAPGPLHPNTSHHTPVRSVKTLPTPIGPIGSSPLGINSGISRYERRGKLRKGSTASCSSSDASDEDSEGRNKRKGSTKSIGRGRGPQDPGAGAGGTGSAPPSGGESTPGDQNGTNHSPSNRGRGNQGDCPTGGSVGRRRCETRLRESQSLNRITEVQEIEPTSPKEPESNKDNKPLLKTVSESKSSSPVNNGGGKRNVLMGKYLMLQRKLCLPLLGGSSKSKQCKDDVNQNHKHCSVGRVHPAQKCYSLC